MTPGIAWDVLGLGCAAVDDLVYVNEYPKPDTKAPVLRRSRRLGGLTATALVAAARFGVKAAYAGNLGTDDLSTYVIKALEKRGVDVSLVRTSVSATPIHATIIVDESASTRTILYQIDEQHRAQEDWPSEHVLRNSKVLFVDHFGSEGMSRAAKIARASGIPVVADFEVSNGPGFEVLLDLVDHLIVGRELAETLTGKTDGADTCAALLTNNRALSIVTDGPRGCWFTERGRSGSVQHFPAFTVVARDTTGCGDVFHGVYAAALSLGWPTEKRIRFASAAAAIKAKGPRDGDIAFRDEIESFLQEEPQ